MSVVPDGMGILRVGHELLKSETRSVPVPIQSNAKLATNHPVRQRCSFCGRVRQGEFWEEPGPKCRETSRGIVVAYSVRDDCMLLVSVPGSRSCLLDDTPGVGKELSGSASLVFLSGRRPMKV